jgi:hypothetical protein
LPKSATNPDAFADLLDHLASGQDLAPTLLQIYSSAEARLMVAMATVAEQDGPDGGGGEEISKVA